MLKKYGITFEENSLIKTALTHTSYSNEHNVMSYERLEFLGDAVLELVFTDYIYNNTNLTEGEMSRLRSSYVCEEALYEYSKDFNLKDYIKLGNGVKEANKTVIADVFEALIGVIYLEKGLDVVKSFFNKLIVPYIENNIVFLTDYKTVLQELVQTEKKSLEYKVINESGPAHNKRFEVTVSVNNIVFGVGVGKSKKEAEQNAAKDALNKRAN